MALMVALPNRIRVSVMARKSGSFSSTYSLMHTALLLADLTLRPPTFRGVLHSVDSVQSGYR